VEPYEWALRFVAGDPDRAIEQDDLETVWARELGRDAALAAPTPDHFLPLVYVLAQGKRKDAVTYPVEGFERRLGLHARGPHRIAAWLTSASRITASSATMAHRRAGERPRRDRLVLLPALRFAQRVRGAGSTTRRAAPSQSVRWRAG